VGIKGLKVDVEILLNVTGIAGCASRS